MVSASPPQELQPLEHSVFRLGSERLGSERLGPERLDSGPGGLEPIPIDVWQQIVAGRRPLEPANATTRLLILSGRSGVCERVSPVQLQTDAFGFVLTWHADPPPPLPGAVVDSRWRFLQRFVSHRHSWQPEPATLARALQLAGFAVPGSGRLQ